jgi:AraC-like DNA-binding protein
MKSVKMPSREAVQAVIAASLQQHGASLQDVARQLRVSARSLQRHLAEIGTSYSELVTQVRLDTACRLLIESSERMSQIALRLGYAGPSSFSRTFMRLMKIQPATYRRQRGRAAAPRDGNASVGSPH